MLAEDQKLAEQLGDDAEATLTATIVGNVTKKSGIDVDSVIGKVMRAQEVSLCFVLDTTASMDAYITAVKDQIREIVEKVAASNCKLNGVAFVGYKDFNSDQVVIPPPEWSSWEFKTITGAAHAWKKSDSSQGTGGAYWWHPET